MRYGWVTTAEVIAWCRQGWSGNDMRELARRVRAPTLVIHGDADGRVPHANGLEIHGLVPGARLLVAGPRLDPGAFPRHDGLEVRPYVHNLT